MKYLIFLSLLFFGYQSSNAQSIARGEYFFDEQVDYGGGNNLNVPANNGSVDVSTQISVAGLEEGIHRLFVRFQDANGLWGQTANYAIYVKRSPSINLVRGEYFWDEQLPYGTATPFSLSANSAVEINTVLDISELPAGIHRLFVRFQDAEDNWSQTNSYPVRVQHDELILIVAGEYFFDAVGDYGTGLPIPIDNPAATVEVDAELPIPPSVPPGQHDLYYRFRDSNGKWTDTYRTSVCTGVSSADEWQKTEDMITVYPNPVSADQFTVVLQLDGRPNVTFKLYDQLGRLFKSMTSVTDTQTFNAADLPPGLYTLTAESENQKFRRRIVIQ